MSLFLTFIVFVVLGFFICWAPFHAQRLLYVYGKNLPFYLDVNEVMFYITGAVDELTLFN